VIRAAHGLYESARTKLSNKWAQLSLTSQFLLLSSLLVLASHGVLGYWVSKQIESGIKLDVATRDALFMESRLSPFLQELATSKDLSQESANRLDLFLAGDRKSEQLEETKVWNLDGKILYSFDKSIVGKTFPLTDRLRGAAAGQIKIEFNDDPSLDEINPNSKTDKTFFDIYIPIRSSNTAQVITIAEFRQDATDLETKINNAGLQSWGITGLVSLGIIAGLYQLVVKANSVIQTQQKSLDERIHQLSKLLVENKSLKNKVQVASHRSAENSERHLRRIGSDLHDGVAQLLTIALLKLESVFGKSRSNSQDYVNVHGLLSDAMREIRDMAAGLALPEIDTLNFQDALKLIIARHERRTSTHVDTVYLEECPPLSNPVKLCLCRFVQEGLNNAFLHAGGVQQTVTVMKTATEFSVCVSDKGPGMKTHVANEKRKTLGLIGLQNRLESLGGKFEVFSELGQGTSLSAILPMAKQG
jgi:signal transduction histidine kinase